MAHKKKTSLPTVWKMSASSCLVRKTTDRWALDRLAMLSSFSWRTEDHDLNILRWGGSRSTILSSKVDSASSSRLINSSVGQGMLRRDVEGENVRQDETGQDSSRRIKTDQDSLSRIVASLRPWHLGPPLQMPEPIWL
jgi:hypothetical protein